MAEADPVIRRVQRYALLWCAAGTVAAVAWRPGDPALAAGVLGGGLLSVISLFAIRSSIDALMRLVAPRPAADGDPGEGRPAPGRAGTGIALKLAGRYGLLGLAAYVMMARLRLHPVGLLIGASSLVAGASFEAARTLRRP